MRRSDEAAKRLLEQADSHESVKAAIQAAMRLGMPLAEIEQYLDTLDLIRAKSASRGVIPQPEPPTGAGS
jgi:hypothetical protein